MGEKYVEAEVQAKKLKRITIICQKNKRKMKKG